MDCIFALATARAKSALAMIRISGQDALSISEIITQNSLKSDKPKLCWLYEVKKKRLNNSNKSKDKQDKKKIKTTQNNQVFDQAVVTYYQSPKSFTGEDMVEFSIHGSLIIIKKLEQALVDAGARPAHPGEFSQRAFLNGKIDLTGAEAICDLIDAQNEIALSAAIGSMQGSFAKKVKSFVQELIAIRVEIEAEIDFIDEGIEFKSQKDLHQKIKNIYLSIRQDLKTAKNFQKITEGIQVALIGPVNVGKSSLMNALLETDRAIVSDEAGTTRDTLFENYECDDLQIKLVDTAGIRKSDSKAENIGIERTYEAMNQADILLIVDDMTHPLTSADSELIKLKENKNQTVLWVHNKLDLYQKNNPNIKSFPINPMSQTLNCKSLFVSAKTGKNLKQLRSQLVKINQQTDMSESVYLARERHIHALEKAKQNLKQALEEIQKGEVLLDLLAEQLRYSHQALEEILGVYPSDELLGEIFSNFCIGK